MLQHIWIYFSDGVAKCRRCGLMTICPDLEEFCAWHCGERGHVAGAK